MKAINLERVFDMMVHMKDQPGESYQFDKGIKLDAKQQGTVITKAIQAFMQSSGKLDGDMVIQAFSGSADLPQLTKDVFNVTQAVPEYDTLWQKCFKGVTLRKGQLSWEVTDVADGMTFSLVPEGGKAKIYGVSGNKVVVSIEKYGAGLGVTWEMVEGRKLYQFVDQMNAVRANLNELWGDIHYGLIATAGATNQIAWQTGTETITRDILTLNLGYTTIGEAVKDKGYGNVASAPMQLYVSPTLIPRINQALRATNADLTRSGAVTAAGRVEFPIIPNPTYNSAVPANKGLLVLPGNKIQNSIYMQELGLQERDIMTLSDIKTYWSAFGATVADTDQVAELAFA